MKVSVSAFKRESEKMKDGNIVFKNGSSITYNKTASGETLKSVGEIRPDIGPEVVGFRERKIAKAEQLLQAFNHMLQISPVTSTLQAWERTQKEIEIQKCYLQHENIGAI